MKEKPVEEPEELNGKAWRWIGTDKPYQEWLFYNIYEDKHYTVWEMIPRLLGFKI